MPLLVLSRCKALARSQYTIAGTAIALMTSTIKVSLLNSIAAPSAGSCSCRQHITCPPVCMAIRHNEESFNAAAWTRRLSPPHRARVRLLAHIKKLDDCFAQFLVRVRCPCSASRHIEPAALACLVGWSVALKDLAPRLRCSQCGRKDAEVVAVARSRPRGIPKTPHQRRKAHRFMPVYGKLLL